MFSPPSVSPLLFSPSSAPGLLSGPTTVHSPLSSQCGPPTIQMFPRDKAPTPGHDVSLQVQSPLHCAHPFLLLTCHSCYTPSFPPVFRPLNILLPLSGLVCLLLLILLLPPLGRLLCPPSSGLGPSCSGSKKMFSIFHSIISHKVILASLLPGLPEKRVNSLTAGPVPFIHDVHKNLSSTSCVPGTLLRARDRVVNNNNKNYKQNFCLMPFTF